jgi:cytochrome c-type protein NapC
MSLPKEGSRKGWRFGLSTAFAGLVVGMRVVWGALMSADSSNREEFCISCHEMRKPYEEYQNTVHNRNRPGIRVTCSDCHVPRDLPSMVGHKIGQAYQEWTSHLSRKLGTGAEYEAHRYEMAKAVWVDMKQNDSRECRHCHDESAVNTDLQPERVRAKHAKGKAEGLTCIDCHFGEAHKEPLGPGPLELWPVRKNSSGSNTK